MPEQTLTTDSAFNVTLQHTLITHDAPSSRVMIILPGHGYTAESPLMRYVGQIGYKAGYDVLRVRYGIHITPVDHWIMRIPDINTDTQNVVSQVINESYTSVCIVGKSLGTMITAQLIHELTDRDIRALMLTPVQNAVSLIPDTPTLAIIGTGDPVYNPDHVHNTDKHTWHIYDSLNHSLEYDGDWAKSVALLPDILTRCEAFIR